MTLKIAIVTGGTPNLAGPTGVAYLSLKTFSPKLFQSADKYFFTSGRVDTRTARTLSKLSVRIESCDTGKGVSKNASAFTKYFSAGILTKFEPFRLAEFYDRVIWLDTDQINTRELIDIVTNQTCDFGIVDGGPNSIAMDNFIKQPKVLFKDNELASLNYKAPGVCGNFFIVSSFQQGAYERARELYFRLQEDLYGADQAIICILMQEIYKKNTYYSNELFTPHPADWVLPKLISTPDSELPYFLHAFGQPKFWNGLRDPLWNYFYNEWIKLEGTSFAKNATLSTMVLFVKKYIIKLRSVFQMRLQ